MEIKFDKALLWLVPYLYLVSVMYYWGYWGTFNIDAFNYYPVTDIVKGVTGPIVSSLSFVASIFGTIVIVLLIGWLLQDKEWFANKKQLAQMSAILILAAPFFLIFYSILSDVTIFRVYTRITALQGEPLVSEITLVMAAFIIGVGIMFNRIKEHRGHIAGIILPVFGVIALLLLPVRAFIDGREIALRTKLNMEFNYIINDSIETDKNKIYKLLGKTGDYYAFLTLDNKKSIIVSMDKINPIIIEKYSLDDKESLRRFRGNARRLHLIK